MPLSEEDISHHARDLVLNMKSKFPPTKRYGLNTEANVGDQLLARENFIDFGREV